MYIDLCPNADERYILKARHYLKEISRYKKGLFNKTDINNFLLENKIEPGQLVYVKTSTKFEKEFDINKSLSADQFKYLKEISNGSKIRFRNVEYKNIIAVLNELDNLEKKVTIVLRCENRNDYPYQEFEKLNLTNVQVMFIEGFEIFPLDNYIKQ